MNKVHYVSMGPWPYFVGFTTNPEAYDREMRRLKVADRESFVKNAWSDATTHFLLKDDGAGVAIICMPPLKNRPHGQYAALMAHEAVHVVQDMSERLGKLGEEAEAYIVQRIVQEGMLQATNSRARIPARPA